MKICIHLGPGHVADSSAAVCGRRHLGPSSAMLQKFGISVPVKGFRASHRLIRFGFVVQGFLVAVVSVLQLQLVIRGFLVKSCHTSFALGSCL